MLRLCLEERLNVDENNQRVLLTNSIPYMFCHLDACQVAFIFVTLFRGGGVPQIQVWNITKNIGLVEEIEIADSFRGRLKGLLGRRSLPTGTGLLLKPCNSIHSCFMRFDFDAVFVSNNLKIVYIIEKMCPFRISPAIQQAQMVLELPAGMISKTGTEIGDQLLIGKRRWC
jgi:uncharacterized membrane protein (UPF0127 family)